MTMMISTTKNNGNNDLDNGGSGDHATIAGLHGGKNNVANGDGEAYLKKGPWTAEEDAILMEYVRKHGEGNWNAVQRHSGLARCGKSCRLRWANHLRPNLKKGAFSPEEERLIVELHAKFGNKWARMASLLPGRTDNEIKNYWNTRVKRHQRQGLPLYPPDIQPQHSPTSHFHHHHHDNGKPASVSIPTTVPTSSFSFQTHHFPSPNTPTHHHHPHTPTSATPPLSPTNTSATLPLFDFSQTHHNVHHHNSYSTPTTPTSFSFQTYQLQEPVTRPLHSHTHNNATTAASAASFQVYHASATTPPPALSPMSSPSTTPTPTNCPTLPLFDFNLPKTPPILQTPMRFRRFSSSPNVSALATNNPSNMNANSHYTMPLSPLHSAYGPNIDHQSPTCFADLTSGDFHTEILKENQEMCSLFAAVTQQELPSSQLLSPDNHNRNTGIGVATTRFGGRVVKKKTSNSFKDKINENMRFALEDLLQETTTVSEGRQNSTEDNIMVLQEQKPKLFTSEGYATQWDQSVSLDFSPGNDQNVEGTEQLNGMPEELTKVLNNLPSSGEMYSDSAEISNGPSSVVTDDNINTGFEMQQIASWFPPAENGRTLRSCSWDNLPGIC